MSPQACTLNAQVKSAEKQEPSPSVPYREVIGSLLYIQNCTRPDIAFPVNFLSRRQIGFTLSDWYEVLKVLKYLKGTPGFGILLTGITDDLLAFSDASLGTSALNGKSTTGYLIKCFGDVVSWKSKKQLHVSLSSCEAEYLAMSEATKELTSIRALIKFLMGIDLVPTLKSDCAPAIAVAMTNDSKTLKHIVKLSMHYVNLEFRRNNLKIEWVSTNDQLADTLTKALPKQKFVDFRSALLRNF